VKVYQELLIYHYLSGSQLIFSTSQNFELLEIFLTHDATQFNPWPWTTVVRDTMSVTINH